MSLLLQVRGLSRRFGGVCALQEIDLDIAAGGVSAIIGPNGAGKSTLFNVITGVDRPDSGEVIFAGRAIHGLPPYRINRLGIARTFQNIRLFKDMSVGENVLVGCHAYNPSPRRLWSGVKSLIAGKAEQQQLREKTRYWLDFFHLTPVCEERAGSLPYGKQRELEIARALAGDPQLLFLDEPAAGMNPQETQELMVNIRRVLERGVTVLLIDHDMKLVMNIAQHITVLNFGRKVAEGTPQQVRQNAEVIRAYLGDDSC